MFVARCSSCKKDSMHLSFKELVFPTEVGSQFVQEFSQSLDDHIFYSVPSSYHVIDESIRRLSQRRAKDLRGAAQSALHKPGSAIR